MSFENSTTQIRDLGSLVSEVPNVLGFVPENSLVLLGVTRDDVPLAMRTDLPVTAHRRTVADYLISTVVEQAQAELVIAVAVGQQDHELCDALETRCHRSGIGLHAVWARAPSPRSWADTAGAPLATAISTGPLAVALPPVLAGVVVTVTLWVRGFRRETALVRQWIYGRPTSSR